jgi:hypothetical protein
MIKILDQIEVSKVLEAYYALENGIVWTGYGQNSRQTGLQYKLNEDPWTSGVGKSKGHELDYDIINPFFKDTIFENIIEKYSLKRTRFMWLGPYSCYSMHRDYTIRIHVPIITNPDCYFVFKLGEVIHLPADSVYQVTTTQLHTFINCSNSYRLHLIGIPTFTNTGSN